MEENSGNVQIRKVMEIVSSLSGTMSLLDKLVVPRGNRLVVEVLDLVHVLR